MTDFSPRLADALVTVLGADGAPLAHADVTVEQRRHAFAFGCTPPSTDPARAEERRLWLDLFDTATLPVYWGRFEPERGRTATEEVLAEARALAADGVRLKGHPLVWHYVKPEWLDALPLDEAEQLLRARIRREVGAFAELIDTWDAINEVVIMPRFANEPDGVTNAVTRLAREKGRVGMVELAFSEARSLGTGPALVLNDFDLGPEYERLIEDVLEAGIRPNAIGLQSHMHQGFRGEEQIAAICDRFARFGLPLHWTETTLVSGELMPAEIEDLNDHVVEDWPTTPEGEARQADEMVRHYETLVAHPAVEAITYWGFDDAGAWLGAPGGFLRRDGSPKPAYEALRSRIRGDWWLEPTVLRTDAEGRIGVRAFAGDFALSSAGAGATVSLPVGSSTAEVRLG
ncbi:endo-1,4-beta-xylanase [Rathayibacter sp. AY2B5]|uniref:endo-1,4-beta-xylanase n=1 Tax=Rathayibacter sp. AY2B5 TaxID=2080570 RepID=UPI000CE912B8|nr:endo-1,4-beta-xylanase [Rathayibacter sp. AY2B5]PPG43634.1 1,4-beta-xylanase [Rathayibacter sp. AY2B5]